MSNNSWWTFYSSTIYRCIIDTRATREVVGVWKSGGIISENKSTVDL